MAVIGTELSRCRLLITFASEHTTSFFASLSQIFSRKYKKGITKSTIGIYKYIVPTNKKTGAFLGFSGFGSNLTIQNIENRLLLNRTKINIRQKMACL